MRTVEEKNMGKIQLLDCTLNSTENYIGRKEIAHILRGLHTAKVDIVEVGLVCEPNFRISENLFYSAEDVQNFRNKYKDWLDEDKQYSILLDTTYLPKDRLEFPREWIIRAQLWGDSLEEGLRYSRQLCQKGFYVILLPMESSLYRQDVFLKILYEAVDMKAAGVYVVDYFGRLGIEKNMECLQEADQILSDEMVLGFYGKDERGEVNEFVKRVVAINWRHDLQIDASVCGFSDKARNLRSELLADYLNKYDNGCYKRTGFLQVYDDCLHHFFHEKFLLYYLSALYDCTPKYAEYYFNEIGTSLSNCDAVLSRLPKNIKWNFSKEKAYQYFKDYIKTQYDIAVVIPTCARPQSIDNLLFQSAYQFRKYGIDIIIYDSSEDEKTEVAVRNFQIDGCYNVRYKRYTGLFDGFSLDHKVIQAYIDFANQYKYLWVCRDGLIISIEDCFEKLHEYMHQNIDCIIVDAKFRNDNHESEEFYGNISDCKRLLEDQSARITILGTMIFNSELITKIIEDQPLGEKNYALWLMAAPLHYFAEHPFNIVAYVGDLFRFNAAGSPNSFWNKAGKAMQQWAYYWPHIIDSLPCVYDEAKDKAYRIEMFDFHPFRPNSLIRMRGNGGLTVSLVRKYKTYLRRVCDTAQWKFYLVAIMPRWIARYLSDHQGGKIFRGLRAIYMLTKPVDSIEE